MQWPQLPGIFIQIPKNLIFLHAQLYIYQTLAFHLSKSFTAWHNRKKHQLWISQSWVWNLLGLLQVLPFEGTAFLRSILYNLKILKERMKEYFEYDVLSSTLPVISHAITNLYCIFYWLGYLFCISVDCWETLTWVLGAPAECSCLCGCCPVGTGRWGCWGGSLGNYHSPPPYDPSTGHSPGQTHKHFILAMRYPKTQLFYEVNMVNKLRVIIFWILRSNLDHTRGVLSWTSYLF